MVKLTCKLGLFILGSMLALCIYGQSVPAFNTIDEGSHGISEDQASLIYQHCKTFPNETQLAISMIQHGEVSYLGVKRIQDTMVFVNNNLRIFEIGSITKVFTSTLLASFVLSNEVDLDKTLQEFLAFPLNIEDSITLKQLANHTSGLPRLPTNLTQLSFDLKNPYKHYNEEKLQEYLRNELSLTSAPGEAYAYSNLGAGMLGYLLTVQSGASFENLLQEVIFKKYDMENSTTLRTLVTEKALIQGLDGQGNKTSYWDFDVLVGAGGILSNVVELSHFVLAHFDPANAELSLTREFTAKASAGMDLGLGWHILGNRAGEQWVWHNGGTGGFSSSMALDVDKQNAIIILSNVSPYHPQRNNIDQLCFRLMTSLNERKDR